MTNNLDGLFIGFKHTFDWEMHTDDAHSIDATSQGSPIVGGLPFCNSYLKRAVLS